VVETYEEKMLRLRKSEPHVSSTSGTFGGGGSRGAGAGVSWEPEPEPEPVVEAVPAAKPKPAPTFKIRSVLPERGFALIETTHSYGSPAADPTQRKIQVGDELPEGSVVAITSEGIRVIPPSDDPLAPVGDEFTIPFGEGAAYKPSKPSKSAEQIAYDQKYLDDLRKMHMRAEAFADPSASPADPFASPQIVNYIVNESGLELKSGLVSATGNIDPEDPDAIADAATDHAAQYIYEDTPAEDVSKAAGLDYGREQDNPNRVETWSGDGPGGEGIVFFYEMAGGGGQQGYWERDDGSVVNVTNILFPPSGR
tara:strand:- start:2892 stop:3821 length:930 start_codon:yes stop_codon:yes gene_type:complete